MCFVESQVLIWEWVQAWESWTSLTLWSLDNPRILRDQGFPLRQSCGSYNSSFHHHLISCVVVFTCQPACSSCSEQSWRRGSLSSRPSLCMTWANWSCCTLWYHFHRHTPLRIACTWSTSTARESWCCQFWQLCRRWWSTCSSALSWDLWYSQQVLRSSVARW